MTPVLPRVIGHRGAAGLAPENTLASFALAAELGCRMVEFDVRLSADGVPVVFHDGRLERCTRGHGRVGEHGLAALRRLDAGGGQRIPTLDEVLSLCLARGMAANIEVKPDPGMGPATARAALTVARGLWPADVAPPLLSSFDETALEACAQAAPEWPRGLLVGRVPADWRERVRRLGCVSLNARHDALPVSVVREVKGAGLAVLAYTVNDRHRAQALWQRGVDGVFSDRPDRLS